MNILVIEGSTRSPSSTFAHVEALLAANDTEAQVFHLRELQLPLFIDQRVPADWEEHAAIEELLEAKIQADLIILATPLYWYALSHLMKNYLDHWSYYLRHPRHTFRDVMRGKKFYPVIVGAEPDPAGSAPAFECLHRSVTYINGIPLEGFYGIGLRDGSPHAQTKAAIAQVDIRRL
jgi:multimeric flavodoxin WrbA